MLRPLTAKGRRVIAGLSRPEKVHWLIGMVRHRTPEYIDRYYMERLVEDPQDGTTFDIDVFNALDQLKKLENPTPTRMHAILHEL